MHVASGTRRERSPCGRGPQVGVGDAGAVKRKCDAGPCVDARTDCSHGRPDASVRPDVQALATAILLNRLIKFREVYLKIKQSKYNLERRECTTLKHLTSKYG